MKTQWIIAVFALLAVLVSACSGFPGQPDLDGTSWVLTELQGKPVTSPPFPTLIFKDGQVSGNASCNSFGGSYQRGLGEALKFGPLMSTLMACLDPSAMEQEGVYLGVLGQVAKYRVENGQLYLYDQVGQLLVEFEKKYSRSRLKRDLLYNFDMNFRRYYIQGTAVFITQVVQSREPVFVIQK